MTGTDAESQIEKRVFSAPRWRHWAEFEQRGPQLRGEGKGEDREGMRWFVCERKGIDEETG
eukprot:3766383-Rhodomonas_salina.1